MRKYIVWAVLAFMMVGVVTTIMQMMQGVTDERHLGHQLTDYADLLMIGAFAGFGAKLWRKKFKESAVLRSTVIKTLREQHLWIGWMMVVVVIVHGVASLFFSTEDHVEWFEIITGLISFVFLLGLAGFGLLLQYASNKKRSYQYHKWLAIGMGAFAVAHAFKVIPMALFLTIGFVLATKAVRFIKPAA